MLRAVGCATCQSLLRPILIVNVQWFDIALEHIADLTLEQHRQTHAEGFAQVGVEGKKTAERMKSRRRIAGVEDFADHRLLMGDEGGAGEILLAPKGLAIFQRDFRLRRHPSLGAKHRLIRRLVQRRREADGFAQQARRQRQNNAGRRDLQGLFAGLEGEHHMVATIAQAHQLVTKMHSVRRHGGGQSLHQGRRPAMQAPSVVVEPLVRDAFGAFLGLAQMQHRAFVVLREVLQLQFFDELRDQRLRLRPKPCRTQGRSRRRRHPQL